jgi:hypothetical protein
MVTAAGAHFGQPGYETELLYLAGLAALIWGGSGPFALDQLRRSADSVGVRRDQCARRLRRALHRAIGAHGDARHIGTFP